MVYYLANTHTNIINLSQTTHKTEKIKMSTYKTLAKTQSKDFVILNLTDTQLSNEEWNDGHQNRKILEYTITELIRRSKPDLITISGDIAWAGNNIAYDKFADFIESFHIPWAPIFGNHDNQGGPELVDYVATRYMKRQHCLFEKGDPALGNGNYVITITEQGNLITALLLLDSHDKEHYLDESGKECEAWSKLTPAQIEWYKEQVRHLKALGCKDSILITHIPINAYRAASSCAYKKSVKLQELTLSETLGDECWEDGYKDSTGVQYEDISSFPLDDGVFAAVKEMGLTKHVIAGHDHCNNWMIRYEGIQLIFALNTGPGCYWNPILNGGTVIQITEDGVKDIHHEYVDVSHLI